MSVGAGAVGGGAGEDESGTGVLSTSTSTFGRDVLPSVGPLAHHLLPPAAVGE